MPVLTTKKVQRLGFHPLNSCPVQVAGTRPVKHRSPTQTNACMKQTILLAFAFFIASFAIAQKQKEDSLRALLAVGKTDSNRVNHLWQLADVINPRSPDSAMVLAQSAMFLARRINYVEGESRSLGIMANAMFYLGNYPRALEYNFEKLHLEEKRDRPANLASAVMNIGILYVFEEEYQNALGYYLRADSLIQQNNLQELKYPIDMNIGDLYDRMKNNDSARFYYSRSLELARAKNDTDYIGTSLLGLGHTARKSNEFNQAAQYYLQALKFLTISRNEVLLCETLQGLGKLYEAKQQNDSGLLYTRQAYQLAVKDGFTSSELESAQLLSRLYYAAGHTDSAYALQSESVVLSDSINSRNRIRQVQMLSINEQLRQREMEDARERAATERSRQLQYLFISIFIPLVFLFTFFLSKRRIPVRIIRSMGIISLLILFEFLTLLLHPVVSEITHHKPILELLLFVCIAALLIPAHHRIEHWIIEKLTEHHHGRKPYQLKLKVVQLKPAKKKPSR